MATFTQRPNKRWQVRIRKKGYPVQSHIFNTKAAAERWARQVESEMDRGVFLSTSTAEHTTFGELIERYEREVVPTKKSQQQTLSHCGLINRNLGTLSVAAITPKVLAEFRDDRLQRVSGHTVRKDLLLIRRILVHAQKEWEIYLPRGNPVDSVTIPVQPKGRERRLLPGEEERLLNAAQNYGGEIEPAILLAIETGMRRGEMARLNWKHITIKKRIAKLYDTKNGEDRTIPLSTKACKILLQLPRNISGKVFVMRPDTITQAFQRVCKLAGIEGLRFHDLRHEATSRFFEQGLSIMEVSSITGHKDLTMLKRYTHLKAEDLAQKLN